MDAADQELVAGLRRGDERAFARLVSMHQPSFQQIARTWVRNASAAEEVVQKAWMIGVETLHRFEERSSLRTWLYGIVINVARSHARSERRTVPLSSLIDEELAENVTAVDAERFVPDDHRWAG